MSQELSTDISPEIINSLILNGDMSKLTPAQQTQYYHAVCKDLGLNPLTQPFAIFSQAGKKVMYATKGCTQQLANIRKIDTEILSRETKDSVYIVTVRATMSNGRKTDEDGIVGIVGLKGNDLANAMLKAITKAKRRAVLALCGLNMSDESEVEDIRTEQTVDISKSKVEKIVNQVQDAEITKSEVKEDGKKETEKVRKTSETVSGSVGESRKEKSGNTTDTGVSSSVLLPEGHKTTQGIITEIPKTVEIGEERKLKWVFKMGEHKLGTFDPLIFKGITDIMDLQGENPILLHIEYKERETTPGKFVKDIVKFSQVTANQVPI